MNSRGHKSLTVDFCPARNGGSLPSWCPMAESKKERFAIALDQNIQEIILKLDFYCLMRQKG